MAGSFSWAFTQAAMKAGNGAAEVLLDGLAEGLALLAGAELGAGWVDSGAVVAVVGAVVGSSGVGAGPVGSVSPPPGVSVALGLSTGVLGVSVVGSALGLGLVESLGDVDASGPIGSSACANPVPDMLMIIAMEAARAPMTVGREGSMATFRQQKRGKGVLPIVNRASGSPSHRRVDESSRRGELAVTIAGSCLVRSSGGRFSVVWGVCGFWPPESDLRWLSAWPLPADPKAMPGHHHKGVRRCLIARALRWWGYRPRTAGSILPR